VNIKAVLLQAWGGPEFPNFLTMAQDGGKVVSRAIVRSEGFMSMKNSMTPSGIQPVTFRYVAEYLNHCATAVPSVNNSTMGYTPLVKAHS
jgi:hypothetical protein